MPHRIKTRQAAHDQKVREIAKRLRRTGYFVRADLPGHPRPPSFGGVVPDIWALKRDRQLIYEIETPESLETDRPQQKILAREARKTGAKFRILTIA